MRLKIRACDFMEKRMKLSYQPTLQIYVQERIITFDFKWDFLITFKINKYRCIIYVQSTEKEDKFSEFIYKNM